LERDGAHVGGSAAQRHRIALLALLVVARDCRLPRERVMALLWPDHDTHRARHSLNVALHALRTQLGKEALRSEGGDIQLDLAHVTCDLLEFRQALREGNGSAFLDLYAGPFLDGFYIDGADELSAWREDERARIDAEYVEGLTAYAERLEEAGTWREAAAAWQALWDRARDDPRYTLRLMRAFEAAGDRPSALRVADEHGDHMEREFDEPIAPAVRSLAELLRQRSQGELPSVVEPPGPPPLAVPLHAAAAATTSGPDAAAASRAGRRRPWLVGAGALLVVATLVALTNAVGSRDALPSPASVAVLPFVDMSAAGDQAYLGDGLTEEILNALTRVRGLNVASRSSAFQFRGDGVDLREVGRTLNVATVVEGSVRQDGERLRVTVQLIDARDGFHLWSEQYDRELRDVFALQEDIAREIASALGDRLLLSCPTRWSRR
jgi:TolB-like protein/DNA-binding SARP family transcriptional activator